MPKSLAVRTAYDAPGSPSTASPAQNLGSTAITRVHEVLDAFSQRDPQGEILTAVRHFPAREPQWAEFPAWARTDLVAAYAAKGIRRPYSSSSGRRRSGACGKKHCDRHAHGIGQDALLQPPDPQRHPGKSATAARCIFSPPKPSPRTSSPSFTT